MALQSRVEAIISRGSGGLTGEPRTQSGAWRVSFRLRLLLAFLFGLPHTCLTAAKEG